MADLRLGFGGEGGNRREKEDEEIKNFGCYTVR